MGAGRRTQVACTGTEGRTVVLAVVVLVGLASGSFAAETIDQVRLDAARARAEQRWNEAQFNQLPIAFDRTRISREMAAYSGSVVAFVADALLAANPSRVRAVIDYVNEDIVAFVVSHKESYLCLMAQHYYNFPVPVTEIKNFREPGETWIYEISYVLVNTDAAREKARIAIPGGDYPAVLSSTREFVKRYGWRVTSQEKVSLGCADRPTS